MLFASYEVRPTALALAGVAAGWLLCRLQRHPTRALGLVPFGATGLFLALVPGAVLQSLPDWLFLPIGVMVALVNVPLVAARRATLPAGAGVMLLHLVDYVCLCVLVFLVGGLAQNPGLPEVLWLPVVLAGAVAAIAWYVFLRDAFDQMLEWLTWPLFRIRGHGPGLQQIPRQGPLVIISNHTAWFDPIWLGKVLPRRLTGMLTSMFFDLPVLHFLATKVVPTIRVEDSRYRREAPELQQVIAALDRGESILLFPEGQMRKREDRPLHPFGRGVWHILHERPQTPVVVCWIEGGWGSFTSYQGGAPTKNKRFDFWRKIDVAVAEPEVLDAGLLVDQRATRKHLMQKVLDARKYLGLEPLLQVEFAHSEKGEE